LILGLAETEQHRRTDLDARSGEQGDRPLGAVTPGRAPRELRSMSPGALWSGCLALSVVAATGLAVLVIRLPNQLGVGRETVHSSSAITMT